MESRLEKIFSMEINSMSLAVWLGEDRKCSAAVVGLDLLLGLSMVRNKSRREHFPLDYCRVACMYVPIPLSPGLRKSISIYLYIYIYIYIYIIDQERAEGGWIFLRSYGPRRSPGSIAPSCPFG